MGNSNAPNRYMTPEKYPLGNWQAIQRNFFKTRKLSPDRIKRLEEIGFTWDIYEEKFEKGFQETLIYKSSMGNPNTPYGYKTAEGYQLGNWQAIQRQFYKKGKLSPERIKRLEDIGFKWDIYEEKFEKGFQETLICKKSIANPNVPALFKTPEGYELGKWQSHQRNSYKKEKLSPERIKRLEEIGFKWEIRDEQVEEQFKKGLQETLLYKESKGNPNAPQSYKTAEGYRLSSWQSRQRRSYKKGKLSPDRIKCLEEISFKWELLDEQFEKGFQETLIYKESRGNPNAPDDYITAEGYSLGTWQRTRRGFYKKGKLSPDRIKQLEEIGFSWSIFEEQFEKGLQETLIYKESTGNPNAPDDYKTAEGYTLGHWQRSLMSRYKKGKLHLKRIKQLEDIGFKWGLLDEKFEKGFKETLLYKESTSNPNAAKRHKTAEGYPLGTWQQTIRSSYKKKKLSPDRVKRLEEIGFTWDPLEEQFEKGFQETLIYKESTGTPNAATRYKTAEGYPLGRWQDVQRQFYKKGKLSTDRIKRLEEIGFKWRMQK